MFARKFVTKFTAFLLSGRLDMQSFSFGNAVYSTKFNPSNENLIGCVANENFGIRGSGFLTVINRGDHDEILQPLCSGKYTDALFDVTWLDSEWLATSAGDGRLCFWSASGGGGGGPIKSLPVHAAEAHAIDTWEGKLISCGWDAKIGLIDVLSCAVLRTFSGEQGREWSNEENALMHQCASMQF